MLVYALYIIEGKTVSPIIFPKTLPPTLAINEYNTYLSIIELELYPNAFIVPIFILCSSTILVIVVKHINAANEKKNTGNILDIDSILSAEFL